MPLQVELVAADRRVWSGEASMVVARTVEGEMGVLPGHAPVLARARAAARCGSRPTTGEQVVGDRRRRVPVRRARPGDRGLGQRRARLRVHRRLTVATAAAWSDLVVPLVALATAVGVLVAAAFGVFVVRRLLLTRDVGTFDCSMRRDSGASTRRQLDARASPATSATGSTGSASSASAAAQPLAGPGRLVILDRHAPTGPEVARRAARLGHRPVRLRRGHRRARDERAGLQRVRRLARVRPARPEHHVA